MDDEEFPISGPVDLAEGDILLLFTDGVLEATSPQQEMFGLERVIEAVRSELDGSSKQIMDTLCEAVLAFCGQDKLQDDVTVVAITVNSHPPHQN